MTVNSELDKVVHSFIGHADQIRIRKLLWVLCYQKWENDTNRLCVNMFQVGFIYVFNLVVGVGALTMPKAFAHAGWLLATVMLILLAVIR